MTRLLPISGFGAVILQSLRVHCAEATETTFLPMKHEVLFANIHYRFAEADEYSLDFLVLFYQEKSTGESTLNTELLKFYDLKRLLIKHIA